MKHVNITFEIVAAIALLAAAHSASAGPILQIVNGSGIRTGPSSGTCTPTDPSACEVIGDAGGTHVPGGVIGPGPGLPTINGGWSDTGSFSEDQSFGLNRGITGWHSSFLNLTAAADVTFQFMGGGDSTFSNLVFVIGGVPSPLFTDSTPTCFAPGNGSVSCSTPGVNQFTFHMGAGAIPFGFVTGNGITLDNQAGINPDPHTQNQPGYFLGIDPYLASGAFQNTGTAVYAGLTDTPALGDHDYQDMGVRISVVPEPASLALLTIGALGFRLNKRHKTASQLA